MSGSAQFRRASGGLPVGGEPAVGESSVESGGERKARGFVTHRRAAGSPVSRLASQPESEYNNLSHWRLALDFSPNSLP